MPPIHSIVLCLFACVLLSFTPHSSQTELRSGHRQTGDRALFFAVNEYDHLSNLTNPIQNARDIANELEASYGFKTEIITNPTFDQMDQTIKRYQQSYANGLYASDGQLLIYFSGHGVRTASNGYFMAKNSDPTRLTRTSIEYGHYRDNIDLINCQHILVAIDACHSATFDPNFSSRTDRRFKRKGEEQFDRILANHKSYKTRVFWTSDGIGAQTPDRSSFAYQLLEGLRIHQSSTGYLRSSELFSIYLEKANPAPGGGSFGVDEPSSCFLFFQLNASPDLPLRPEMIHIPGGSFDMGSNGNIDEQPIHRVSISPFSLAETEITVEQFEAFVLATSYLTEAEKKGNSQVYQNGKAMYKAGVSWKHDAEGNLRPRSAYNHPVIHVSWSDAIAYCHWLSKETGDNYRLPTEAEWEYVAGNGRKHTRYSWGKNAPTKKRGGNVRDETKGPGGQFWDKDSFKGYQDGYFFDAPVKQFQPNDFALYDMTGNVLEWCQDWFHSDYYANSPASDPKGQLEGTSRIIRGGGWSSPVQNLLVSFRSSRAPNRTAYYLGFRPAKQ